MSLVGCNVESLAGGGPAGARFTPPASTPTSTVNDIGKIGLEKYRNDTRLVGGLVLPEKVTEIGHAAFEGCTGITSVSIPDSVTVIGRGAFRGCTSLSSASIAASTRYRKEDFPPGCRVEMRQAETNPADPTISMGKRASNSKVRFYNVDSVTDSE